MKNYSVFDVLGPVMIGPSSSHTAGAARLGKVARGIVGEDFNKVEFYLHGSFAETYKGHGTDRALVAGVLGMYADDERLRTALQIAKDRGLDVEFIKADFGDEHPNTVKMVFHMNDGSISEIMGSSIGGGNIVITSIDGEELEFTGSNPTLIVKQRDMLGLITGVTTILNKRNIYILSMKMGRTGDESFIIVEIDSEITKEIIKLVEEIPSVTYVKAINIVK